MAKYNGHKNWNHWNVSLWINNDEGLYRTALDHVRNCSGTKEQAARNFVDDLISCGITKTPDGAPYSLSAVRAAKERLREYRANGPGEYRIQKRRVPIVNGSASAAA